MNSWQQPTTGEPATGSMHWRGVAAGTTSLFAQASTGAYAWYTITFANVPQGSGVAWAVVETTQVTISGDQHIYFRKYGDATTCSDRNLFFDKGQTDHTHGLIPFPISSTKGGDFAANTTAFNIYVWDPVFYNL